MTIANATTALSHLIVRNSPAILTGIGIAGVVATSLLTGKAYVQAHEAIEKEELDRISFDPDVPIEPLTAKEKFQLTWTYFIPPVVVGGGTIICIFSAQTLNMRRNAALMGLYTLTERAATEFREKTRESLGEGKFDKIQEEIAKDRAAEAVPSDEILQKIDRLSQAGPANWCLDTFSGREFICDTNTLKAAQNTINEECINHNYASLNDYYAQVGLSSLPVGETLGWTTENKLELAMHYAPMTDGRAGIIVGFKREPKTDYYSAWG